jgi:hypothetical protein
MPVYYTVLDSENEWIIGLFRRRKIRVEQEAQLFCFDGKKKGKAFSKLFGGSLLKSCHLKQICRYKKRNK